MGLSYIGGSERKFQSDNGSAALLRRRTAFLLRGIRVGGGLGGWRNGAASGERKFSSERIAGGTELLAARGNF